MQETSYSLYIDGTLNLAESLVVVLHDSAGPINSKVMIDNGVNSVNVLDKSTWKYYMNLCGEYHSTDTVMVVNSLDTLEEIDFTKFNLEMNPKTKAAYMFGSKYYNELVVKYPEQARLILSIVYPADMATVLAADNGTIVSYATELVEEYEYSLISKLQEWVYLFHSRYYNAAYRIAHDLYIADYYTKLAVASVLEILSIRLNAIRTSEVHSYHLKTFLNSKNKLDEYYDILSRKQLMFLYRNIDYIRKHCGHTEVFSRIVEEFITSEGFSLVSYSARHDVDQMIIDGKINTSDLLPRVGFKKTEINDIATALTPSKELVNLEAVDLKMRSGGLFNQQYQDYNRSGIESSIQYSPSGVIKTKFLESMAVDYSRIARYRFENILFDSAVYWAASYRYKATVDVFLPVTRQTVTIDVLDAVRLYYYAAAIAMGLAYSESNHAVLHNLYEEDEPTTAELLYKMNNSHVDATDAAFMLSNHTVVSTLFSSPTEVYHQVIQIFKNSKINERYIASADNEARRSCLQMMTDKFFKIKSVALGGEFVLSEVLQKYEIDFTKYTPENYYELTVLLKQAVTGEDVNEKDSIEARQKVMTELVKKLCSYSVYITTYTLHKNLEGVYAGALRYEHGTTSIVSNDSIPPSTVNDSTVTNITTADTMDGFKLVLNDPANISTQETMGKLWGIGKVSNGSIGVPFVFKTHAPAFIDNTDLKAVQATYTQAQIKSIVEQA